SSSASGVSASSVPATVDASPQHLPRLPLALAAQVGTTLQALPSRAIETTERRDAIFSHWAASPLEVMLVAGLNEPAPRCPPRSRPRRNTSRRQEHEPFSRRPGRESD